MLGVNEIMEKNQQNCIRIDPPCRLSGNLIRYTLEAIIKEKARRNPITKSYNCKLCHCAKGNASPNIISPEPLFKFVK